MEPQQVSATQLVNKGLPAATGRNLAVESQTGDDVAVVPRQASPRAVTPATSLL